MLVAARPVQADKLVRIAGGGTDGANVPATQAKLAQPFGIDFDKAGNYYVAELAGERVLKVDPKGMLTIVGGTGKKGNTGDGGPARAATFNGMHSLAVTPDGTVYVADTWNHRVRKIDPAGKITPFAGTGKKGDRGNGGPAVEAELGGIYCVAFNADFSKLYLTDLDNRKIRVVNMKTGVIDLVAGNGKKGVPQDGADAATQPLVDPRAACVDRHGNVYILERGGHALRVVDGPARFAPSPAPARRATPATAATLARPPSTAPSTSASIRTITSSSPTRPITSFANTRRRTARSFASRGPAPRENPRTEASR
jgi:hypothetical protein